MHALPEQRELITDRCIDPADLLDSFLSQLVRGGSAYQIKQPAVLEVTRRGESHRAVPVCRRRNDIRVIADLLYGIHPRGRLGVVRLRNKLYFEGEGLALVRVTDGQF